MIRPIAVTLAMVVVKAPAQVVPAELPEGPPAWAVPMAERNAALAYHRTWLMGHAALDEITLQVTSSEAGFDFEAGSELDLALSSNAELIADLLEATRIPDADWQTSYEDGIGAALPHLQKIRATARALAADAARMAREGDIDAAADRLAGMYDLARHSASDRVLIASLVSIAVGSLASERVGALLDGHEVSPEARQTILAAIDRMDPGDPFHTKRSFMGEGEMVVAALVRDLEDNNTDRGTGAAFVGVVGAMAGDASALGRIAQSDPGVLRRDAGLMLAFYRDVISAWDRPDAAERIRALESASARQEYGAMVTLLAPSISRAHQVDRNGLATLAEIRARLEAGAATDQSGRAGERSSR